MHGSPSKLYKSPGFRVLRVGRYDAVKGRHFPPHQHTNWELVYYTKGRPLCRMGDRENRGEPGMLWITPNQVIHEEIAETAYSNYYLEVIPGRHAPEPGWLLDNERGSIGRIIAELYAEYRGAAGGRSEPLIAMLAEELRIQIQRAAEPSEIPGTAELAVRKAERLIGGDETALGRVEELARRTGLSVSVLRAYFQQRRGYSPRTAIRAERLRRAVHLLRSSDLGLEEIANLSGFDSASHFSREFQQAHGQSPGRWRRETL